MSPWIVCGILFVAFIVARQKSLRQEALLTAAQHDKEYLRWRHRVLEDRLWSVLSAFCRADFLERRLLVRVEVYGKGDRSDAWVAECRVAPYGVAGSFWKFGATIFLSEEREVMRAWIEAEPGKIRREFSSESDEFQQGKRFIELARRMSDGFKAYSHEQAHVIIETFFGRAEPPHTTSCFTDAHVRETTAASDPLSTT